MYACSKFFFRHSNEALVFSITVGKFFFNRCVPIGPCVPTGTFTLIICYPECSTWHKFPNPGGAISTKNVIFPIQGPMGSHTLKLGVHTHRQ